MKGSPSFEETAVFWSEKVQGYRLDDGISTLTQNSLATEELKLEGSSTRHWWPELEHGEVVRRWKPCRRDFDYELFSEGKDFPLFESWVRAPLYEIDVSDGRIYLNRLACFDFASEGGSMRLRFRGRFLQRPILAVQHAFSR